MKKALFVWLSGRWHEQVVRRLHRWTERLDGVGSWLEDQAGLTEAEWDQELYDDAA